MFACAGAIAALRVLAKPSAPQPSPPAITFNLLNPDAMATIAIDQVAPLSATTALAMTHSDPGDNLDLTRNTPIWSLVELDPVGQTEAMAIAGGEGIGIQQEGSGPAAIYRYAQQLLRHHLETERKGHRVRVTVILPEGRALAERTSNAAFGVVEGLSLLGTGGIAQPLSAPDQLEIFRQQLRAKAAQFQHLVFCIGENGLALAPTLGFPEERLVKTANWLGPLLVEAGMQGVKDITLLGYHGKLIKLAGGIFHTHHHVADGRQEILTAIASTQGLPHELLKQLYDSATLEAGLALLRAHTPPHHRDEPLFVPTMPTSALIPTPVPTPTPAPTPTEQVYGAIAQRIDQRATDYIRKHCGEQTVATQVGSILFDRQRQVIIRSIAAVAQLESFK